VNPRARTACTALALFAIAFAVRAANDLSFHRAGFVFFEKPVLDAAFYDDWARRIAGGEWIGSKVFEGVPLYGYFLAAVYALFGTGPLAIALVQAAIGAAGVALLYLFCREVFSEPVALVAAALDALYAPAIFYESFRLADGLATFFTPALLLASLALLRRPTLARAAATGLLVGVATLARERFALFAPVLLAMLVVRHRRRFEPLARPVLTPLLLAIGVALPLAASLAHNLAAAGDPVVLSSAGGVNFFVGNRPDVTGSYDPPRDFGLERDGQYARAREIAEREEGRALRASEVSSYWTRRGLEAWQVAPGDMLVVVWRKLSNFWKGFELHDAVDYAGSLRESTVLSLPLPSFRVVGPLALVGLVVAWRVRRRDPLGIAILYGMIGAHLAFLLAFFVTSRFRVSVVPALLPFAAATLVWLFERARARRLGSVAAGAAALGLAAWFVNVDPSFVDAAAIEARTHASRGEVAFGEKRFADAERELREALRLEPALSDAAIALARTLQATGRGDEALAVVEQAVARDPANARVRGAHAEILLSRHEPRRALDELAIASRAEPRNGYFAFNVGLAHEQLGETAEAIAAYTRAADLEPALAAEARTRAARLAGGK
jgi:4-amino-4-deoxy-L-arabinose transferase-like glycosyltransferase